MGNKTRELCEFLVNLNYDDIGDINIKDIKYRTLDWLGCVIAAQNLPSVTGARTVVLEQGGNNQSTIIGSEIKTSAVNAAFCNGIAGHALEYDDTNKIGITHPGAPVMAAAFAMAESLHCNFKKFALAVTVGYETMIRLGGAVNPNHYKNWHTTGTCGTFAAAAATGIILDLDSQQMEQAFGIASTMASGLVNVFGTDAKLVTVGNAAKNGILAAQLAKNGLSAPKDSFASKNGYAKATNSSDNLSFMVPNSDDALLIEDAYYKIHASCGHTHSALDALQFIMSTEKLAVEDIEKITVDVYETAYNLCKDFKKETDSKAKFSLPYCLAAMVKYGQCTLTEFEPNILESKEIKEIANKIFVVENSQYTTLYPKLRLSKVCVRLKNNTEIEKIIDLPIGKPPFEFIEKKYLSLCEMAVSTKLALEIKEKVLSISEDSPITTIGDLLRNIEENIIYKI